MDSEELCRPVSADAPCGPDLEAEDDDAFIDFYFDAISNLPESYVQLTPWGEYRLFDKTTVQAADLQTVDALLARSRDLRLVVLAAQLEALRGDLGGLARAVSVAADLLDTFGDALHPALPARAGRRTAALAGLASQQTVILPLFHMPLTGDEGDTYRAHAIAEGLFTRRDDEEEGRPGDVVRRVASPAKKAEVDAAAAHLAALRAGLQRIAAASKAELKPVLDAASRVEELIFQARPDLAAAAVEAVAEAEDAAAAQDAASEAAPGAGPGTEAAAPAGAITSHEQARAQLEAVENYLRRAEPASAALLPIAQARNLVGVPFLEALAILLPDRADAACLHLGGDSGLQLTPDRLRALQAGGAGDAPDAAVETGLRTPPTATPPVTPVTTNAEARGALNGVEQFFARNDPASPVPMLLGRARGMLGKDFAALVGEFLPPPVNEE